MSSIPKRELTIIAAAATFGVAVAVLKGDAADVRDSLGNISAPWLLLPYVAGTLSRGWLRGAIVGTLACIASLVGFYAAEAFVLDLGGQPVLASLRLTLGEINIYYEAGVIGAPALGAIGGARIRFRPIITAALVGVTLVGEPLAVFAWVTHAGMSPSDTGLVVRYPALWIGEMALGLVLSTGMLVLNARRVRSS